MSTAARTRSGPASLGRVAVIGGALRGLVAAHELAKAGAEVTVFEASRQWGGPHSHFRRGARSPEQFFRTVLPSDTALLGLLDELTASSPPAWSPMSTGLLHRGRVHRFNGVLDALRFQALPVSTRVKLAGMGLEIRRRATPTALDAKSASRWTKDRLGSQAYRQFAEPLLGARFGAGYERISALRLHSMLHRGWSDRRVRGHFPEGSWGIAEGLLRELRERGVRMVLGAEVLRVGMGDGMVHVHATGVSGTYDRVVLALPEPVVERVLDRALLSSVPLPEIEYMGAVSVYLEIAKSAIPLERALVLDSDSPFHEILEATHMVERVESRDPHIVYLTASAAADAPVFRAEPHKVVREYAAALLDLIPSLTPEDIQFGQCFRARYAEPVHEMGALRRPRSSELVPGRMYLASSSQVYPGVPSWNASVVVGQKVAGSLVTGARRVPPRRLVTAS